MEWARAAWGPANKVKNIHKTHFTTWCNQAAPQSIYQGNYSAHGNVKSNLNELPTVFTSHRMELILKQREKEVNDSWVIWTWVCVACLKATEHTVLHHSLSGIYSPLCISQRELISALLVEHTKEKWVLCLLFWQYVVFSILTYFSVSHMSGHIVLPVTLQDWHCAVIRSSHNN